MFLLGKQCERGGGGGQARADVKGGGGARGVKEGQL